MKTEIVGRNTAIGQESVGDGRAPCRDSTSDRLSVLYKRKDQHYGLIAPGI